MEIALDTNEEDFNKSFSQNVLKLFEEPDIRVLLNLLKLKEPEAYVHSLRVATLMDKTFNASDMVLKGCLLHDIGKFLVPFRLTLFPCTLSENERLIVKMHTCLGVEILLGYSSIILNCVKYHHDAECDIEYVRWLRACDIFDALISERPYRTAYSIGQVKELMEKSGVSPDYIGAITSNYNPNKQF